MLPSEERICFPCARTSRQTAVPGAGSGCLPLVYSCISPPFLFWDVSMCLLNAPPVAPYFDGQLVTSASRPQTGRELAAPTGPCDLFRGPPPPLPLTVTLICTDDRVCPTLSSRKHILPISFLPASALSSTRNSDQDILQVKVLGRLKL